MPELKIDPATLYRSTFNTIITQADFRICP
jgi:hypothetical protein